MRVLKWKILLGKGNFLSIAPVQFLGMTLSNFTPGKIGEPAKTLILKNRLGISVSQSLPSVIWERVLDVCVLLVLTVLGFTLIKSVNLGIIGIVAILLFIAIISGLLTVLYIKRFGRLCTKILKRFSFTRSISTEFLETFYNSRIPNQKILKSLGITSVAWLLEGFVIYYSFLALGIVVADPFILATILAFSTIVGVASTLPGGIGTTDVVMTLTITSFGVMPHIAVAGVLLARLLSIWYLNFLGGLSLIYFIKSGIPLVRG